MYRIGILRRFKRKWSGSFAKKIRFAYRHPLAIAACLSFIVLLGVAVYRSVPVVEPTSTPSDARLRFAEALSTYDTGNPAVAIKQMERLLERDSDVFVEAHRWMAEYIVSKKLHLQSPEFMDRLRFHLGFATSPSNPSSVVAMAEIELAHSRLGVGLRLLESVAADRPDVLLTVAQLHHLLGKSHNAKLAIHDAIAHYQEVANDNQDSTVSQQSLQEANRLLNLYQQSHASTRVGLSSLSGRDINALVSQMQSIVAGWSIEVCVNPSDFFADAPNRVALGKHRLDATVEE